MTSDFRDILADFTAAHVRFLVVGAYALGAHGVPRATIDLDIWIDRTPANVERVWRALTAFGAPLDALKLVPSDFTIPDNVVQFGLPPYRIDILTAISGVEFDEAWPGRLEGVFEDVSVPYIGRDAYIRNKRSSGRLKDLADLEYLGESA